MTHTWQFLPRPYFVSHATKVKKAYLVRRVSSFLRFNFTFCRKNSLWTTWSMRLMKSKIFGKSWTFTWDRIQIHIFLYCSPPVYQKINSILQIRKKYQSLSCPRNSVSFEEIRKSGGRFVGCRISSPLRCTRKFTFADACQQLIKS